jgi:methyl-galactoside transport system permease protein
MKKTDIEKIVLGGQAEDKTSLSVKTSKSAPIETDLNNKPKIKEIDLDDVTPLETNDEIKTYEKELYELRKDGSQKIASLKEAIYSARHDQMLDKKIRADKINEYKKEHDIAVKIEKQNAAKVNIIKKKALALANQIGHKYMAQVATEEKIFIAKAKQEHEKKLDSILADHKAKVAELSQMNSDNSGKKVTLKDELASEKLSYKVLCDEENAKLRFIIQKSKDRKNHAYLVMYNEKMTLSNNSVNIIDSIGHNLRDYSYHFDKKIFLLNNALYITIGIFFIACAIWAPFKSDVNRNIITWANILTILETAGPRTFFALGVAGLILLAGTDLSVGRMVGMGSVFTSVILHNGINTVTFFNMPALDFTSVPMVF